jgi:16S rRNA (guanine966-N2)-methyltransferase
MRIISGKYKGLRLLEPDRGITRPTSDKVRQAVFNILEHSVLEKKFEELSVLDAFAGSGALGLEMLSRGATKCLFVEKSKLVAKVLAENIRSTVKNAEDVEVSIACKDVSKMTTKQYFDLVFLDPPFKRADLYVKVMLNLKQQGAVDPHTVFYAESDRDINDVLCAANVSILPLSSRQIGGIFVSFFHLV